ncbi:hypothetical protein OG949_03110 [Streptomyces scopuliridis]|uniref:hypothetical protein n=1 Tax=Streptomyces scopuliridis TaxID=452529 RepID=UPI002DD9008E|nr:hypothetical protein [Streptomyces scopuliridis]WSB31948.1 hypothetical protein OG949_03110 [Streptomyces scopuliridis]
MAITLARTVIGALFLVCLYALAGARPEPPDLESWLSGSSTAYHSPALLAAIRET